jgi:hypothetical protein
MHKNWRKDSRKVVCTVDDVCKPIFITNIIDTRKNIELQPFENICSYFVPIFNVSTHVPREKIESSNQNSKTDDQIKLNKSPRKDFNLFQ